VNGTDSGNGHPCTPLTLPPNKTTAKIGGTLTLLGSQTGEQMDVTVLKIIDPLPAMRLSIPAQALAVLASRS
jgi:hypothetical protein